MDLKELVKIVKSNALKKYDRDKSFTNVDEGKEMIYFSSKVIYTRKVHDAGRDEDETIYIGLDKKGWIKYIQVAQYGAGPFKIVDEIILRLNNKQLVEFFNSSSCSNEEYLEFMKTALNYIKVTFKVTFIFLIVILIYLK